MAKKQPRTNAFRLWQDSITPEHRKAYHLEREKHASYDAFCLAWRALKKMPNGQIVVQWYPGLAKSKNDPVTGMLFQSSIPFDFWKAFEFYEENEEKRKSAGTQEMLKFYEEEATAVQQSMSLPTSYKD